MSRFREWNVRNKVYVGGLTDAVEKDEIESVFRKYGPVKNSWIAKNPAGFGFIEFENQRDAEDAVKNLDGTRCCGVKIKVEMSNGRSRGGGRFERHDRFRGGGGRDRDRRRFRSRSRSRSPRRRSPPPPRRNRRSHDSRSPPPRSRSNSREHNRR